MILIDIMMAIALSLVFISILTQSNIGVRQIFENAKTRQGLLDMFEAGVGTTTVRLFGNDRIETITAVRDPSDSTDSSSSVLYFSAVRASSSDNVGRTDGTSLCSVDFTNQQIVGSYGYIQAIDQNVASDYGTMGNNRLNDIAVKPIVLPIDPLLPLTDIEVRNDIAYVSADSAVSSDPDLFVFDIEDVNHPSLLASINTGPGLASIALSGNRIYAAAASTAAQLHIIRFDMPNAPILEKKFKLPLPYATATSPFGSAILADFSNDDLIYLGTEKWDGPELSAIDVSDPLNPRTIGDYEAGSMINDISTRDRSLYAAASDEKQLHLIDKTDPTNLSLVDYFGPSGWARQTGKTVSIFENLLSFGRTAGGFNMVGDHELFLWPSITSSVPTISALPFRSIDSPGGVYGIVADRRYLYLATRAAGHEFAVADHDLNIVSDYSLPIAPQTITCDGNRLYILAHSAPAIYEITFQ